ncbi:MAG: MFS transporter [Promethearchaeota archaeon]
MLEIFATMENKTSLENVKKFLTTPYRWVILVAFMVVGITNQMIWVTYAPITDVSAAYFGVDASKILWFMASFMIVYIPVNYFACWLIDKLGLKWGVGIGVILNGVFALVRAFAGHSFGWALFAQIMVAIGQPFIINSFTKMSVTWFPEEEKATASGIALISTFIGVIIAMVLPGMFTNFGETQLAQVSLWYGIVAVIAMVIFFVLVKERPKHYPNAYADKTKAFVTKGTNDLFKIKDFDLFLVIMFVGLGVFNAITSKIDYIFSRFGEDSGLLSGVMIIGAIFGAGILSQISDAKHKRKIFLNMALIAGAIFSLLMGFNFSFIIIMLMSGIFGFFLVSAMPVGMTYAAEISYPIPEESSAGLCMTIGQISGLLFLLVPDNIFLFVMAGLFAVAAIFSFIIKDTDFHEAHRKLESTK